MFRSVHASPFAPAVLLVAAFAILGCPHYGGGPGLAHSGGEAGEPEVFQEQVVRIRISRDNKVTVDPQTAILIAHRNERTRHANDPLEVRWVVDCFGEAPSAEKAEGYQEWDPEVRCPERGERLVIRPKEDQPSGVRNVFRRAAGRDGVFEVPSKYNSVRSGRPSLRGIEARTVVWRYDVLLYDAEGELVYVLDPEVIIKDDH